jgi:hypothetical protein
MTQSPSVTGNEQVVETIVSPTRLSNAHRMTPRIKRVRSDTRGS